MSSSRRTTWPKALQTRWNSLCMRSTCWIVRMTSHWAVNRLLMFTGGSNRPRRTSLTTKSRDMRVLSISARNRQGLTIINMKLISRDSTRWKKKSKILSRICRSLWPGRMMQSIIWWKRIKLLKMLWNQDVHTTWERPVPACPTRYSALTGILGINFHSLPQPTTIHSWTLKAIYNPKKLVIILHQVNSRANLNNRMICYRTIKMLQMPQDETNPNI